MRKLVFTLGLVLAVGLGLAGCDLLDSRNVENPQITEEAALNGQDPLERWTRGLDRQLAIALDNTYDWTEIATDNYVNTQTFFNQNVDDLVFDFRDDDIEFSFFAMNDLRESAEFGKAEVIDADDNPSPENIAEQDFYLGMAHILLGEHFSDAPLEGSGQPASSAAHFDAAISALSDAVNSGDGRQTSYKMALARAHYNQGNADQATDLAQEVLNEDANFVRYQEYDNANGPTNEVQNALYDRGTFDDFQPLPRLDFLDPKYGQRGPVDSPIPYLKAEEAHLILIEDYLAESNLSQAQSQMKDLIDLVESRNQAGAENPPSSVSGLPRTVDETEENRDQNDPGSRPDSTDVLVRASPSDTLRSGLVLNRTASTEVPGVSGTSVTDDVVDNISGIENAWEVYYLMRQEIFIAEGRRFVDFGIKAGLPEDEVLVNDNVSQGQLTQPTVPDFLPDEGSQLDAFTFDQDATPRVATIALNMNRVLAQNRQQVSPFLQ